MGFLLTAPMPPRDSSGNLLPLPPSAVYSLTVPEAGILTAMASGATAMSLLDASGTVITTGTLSLSAEISSPSSVVLVVENPTAGMITAALTPLTTYTGHISVIDYGADPTGIRDSTAAIQAAVDTASGEHPQLVLMPPGRYQINNPIILQNPSSTLTVPGPIPMLTGTVPPGKIGDVDDTSSTTIFCGPNFPSGEYAIQILPPNADYAPSGGGLRNIALNCNHLGAGILIVQPRRGVYEHINIFNTAQPNGNQPFSVNTYGGAFAVVATSSGTFAPAYNFFSDISIANAAYSSFAYADLGKDNFFNCYSWQPGIYNYYVLNRSSWHGCHYSQGQIGWYIPNQNDEIAIFSSLIQVGTLSAPSGSDCHAVWIDANPVSDETNCLVAFYGCQFWNNPAADQGAQGATIRVSAASSGKIANVLIHGSSFQANGIESSPTATAFVWVDPSVTGQVEINECLVNGAPTTAPFVDETQKGVLHVSHTQGYNPVGPITAPDLPASGTAVVNSYFVDMMVYISGGTVTEIAVNGVSTGLTAGSIYLPVGSSLTLTYSAAPTWTWVGR